MLDFGRYNMLKVEKKVDFGFYLTNGEDRVLLPGKYAPVGLAPGDEINVFIYRDSEDRQIATTLKPKAMVGDIALLRVKDVTPVGAFLDWGLEKDLFVPFKEQREKMVLGREYVVYLSVDRLTGRIIASNRFNAITKNSGVGLKIDQEVKLIVYDQMDIAWKVLIDRTYQGFLYKNEVYQPISIGDRLTGYIHKLRPDHKIDVRLRKFGYTAVLDMKSVVMEALKDADGFLPLNSDSSPEAILKQFNMSKKVFKQAIGNLYKARLITIEDDGIRLVEEAPAPVVPPVKKNKPLKP